MISGQELFAERKRIKESLDNSLRRAYENGLEMAEMTRLYRIALHKEIMRQKADGTPTTYLDKVARGTEEVAEAEFNMIAAEDLGDVTSAFVVNVPSEAISTAEFNMIAAEVKYRASNENIMAQKKLFDSIEADIAREYHKVE